MLPLNLYMLNFPDINACMAQEQKGFKSIDIIKVYITFILKIL